MSIRKKLDDVTCIPANFLTETPPAPKSLKVELSAHCNYRCRYCSLTERGTCTDMDFPLFQRIIDDAAQAGVRDVGPFLIGEPFCSPDLLTRAILYLRPRIPYIFLTSNAALATPSRVAACFSSGLHSLKWSVNFADEVQFQELTGSRPFLFHAAVGNIKLAWELRNAVNASTRLYASSILYNPEQKVRMEPLLHSRILPYVDDHYWLPLYNMSESGANVGQPLPGNPGRIDNPVPPVPCWNIFTSSHVLSDGRMTACPFDSTGKWTMGDLNRQSFMEVWHSSPFRALRRAHLSGDISRTPCSKCVQSGS